MDYRQQDMLVLSVILSPLTDSNKWILHYDFYISMDVFVIDGSLSQVSVYSWSTSNFTIILYTIMIEHKTYEKSNAMATIDSSQQIVNVIALDFNHDGILDLLVQSKDTSVKEEDKNQVTKHDLFIGTSQGTLVHSGWNIDGAGDQLSPVDFLWHNAH